MIWRYCLRSQAASITRFKILRTPVLWLVSNDSTCYFLTCQFLPNFEEAFSHTNQELQTTEPGGSGPCSAGGIHSRGIYLTARKRKGRRSLVSLVVSQISGSVKGVFSMHPKVQPAQGIFLFYQLMQPGRIRDAGLFFLHFSFY